MHTITLILSEPKKHSGKYVINGTQGDAYPQFMYLRKEWFGGELPTKVEATFTKVG